MGIFVGAALAGFLLFGWIESCPRIRGFFLNLRMQGVLGMVALYVLAIFVIVLTTQWPSYDVFRIVQDLTGRETAQFILGAVFGCILRYWGPHFWEMRMRPGTRYNWVAISLVGLLLLAAAVPYIGSLLRDWGMTGLKTPVAEFQFAGTTNADRIAVEVEEKSRDITLLPAFSRTAIKTDLDYLRLSHREAERIDEPSVRKKMLKTIEDRRDTYKATQDFINDIVAPLSRCASWAYEKGFDPESIRHALSPVAQELRLLIQLGQSQNSTPSTDPLRDELMKSFDLFEIEAEKKVCRLKLKSKGWKNLYDDPKFLTNAPHIYVVLARLDRYNDNRDMAISILKSSTTRFRDDHNYSPGILFFINIFLASYLYESEHTPEDIFPYLDTALEIAQDTGRKIDKLKSCTKSSDKRCNLLNDTKEQFETYERGAKNALAFFSARTGVRKFMALRYAKENYDDRDKLQSRANKPDFIDTYGYVKMAFAKRSNPPNFDEIRQAKALFQEALDFLKILPETSRLFRNWKHEMKVKLRARLKEADRMLASR